MTYQGSRNGKTTLRRAALGMVMAGTAFSGTAQAEGLSQLVEGGKILIDARYRFESVDQTGLRNDANAQTLRLRAGFQTGKVAGLSLLAEFEGIAALQERYNSSVNGKTAFPIIADPDGGELNRLQIDYTGIDKTTLTVGRQRINLDNQRFVGAVGFRQNEQTYDAVKVNTKALAGFDLTYVYLDRVNRVFGNKSPQGEYTGDTHLMNASYAVGKIGTLTAYGYLLDINQSQTLSTQTWGLRFAGKQALDGGWSAVYEGEYARQMDYKDNPAGIGLNYYHAELGAGFKGFTGMVGFESLGSNGVRGFATPLATLHKFQGYADVFLTTPAAGIVDAYGKVGYETKVEAGPVTNVALAAWYHDYETDVGNRSLGTEVNIEAAVKLKHGFTVLAKYADYDGVTGFASRRKYWLALEYVY